MSRNVGKSGLWNFISLNVGSKGPETSVRILFEFLTLEVGIEELSRNVGKSVLWNFIPFNVGSKGPETSVRILFVFLTLEDRIERLSRNVSKVSYWILDICKWDRKVPKCR